MVRQVVRRVALAAVLGAMVGAACASASQRRDAWPPPGSDTGTCRDGRSWTTSEPEQARMLEALNTARGNERRRPLVRHPILDRMALAHAADMACRNYVDHRNSAGDHLPERLARVNDGSIAAWDRLAEVLGTSVAPARQVERWLGSRPHRRAVLQAEHERVGIGVAHIAGSKHSTYWAVEFLAEPR
ncbi:MAG: CAP domain-containing protein [Acidobacteria bacterium]|nr:CAP domain-containing protein [Acidobacteriota bacterium]